MPTITSQLGVWRATLVAGGLSDSTVASYLDHVEKFAAYLGGTPDIMDITKKSVATYRIYYGSNHAPRTTGLALTSIRSFCRCLMMLELRLDDPTIFVEYPKIPKPLPRSVDADQLHELLFLLDAMPDGLSQREQFHWQRNRLAMLLMIWAGLRLSEVAQLRCGDINLRHGVLSVREGKGCKDRAIPLHPRLRKELEGIAGRPASRGVLTTQTGKLLAVKSWHHVFERWVPEHLSTLSFTFTVHQLRHSFCTELIRAEGKLFDVQILMGHEDPKTTAQYYKAAAEHLRNTVELLSMEW